MEIAGMMDFFVYMKKKRGPEHSVGKNGKKKQNEKVILYV